MFGPGRDPFVVHLAAAAAATAVASDEHDNDMAALSNIWTPHAEISYRMHSTLV